MPYCLFFRHSSIARRISSLTVAPYGLIPPELENHFIGLRTAMESGLPTVRNKTSGHGQGAVPVTIPPHVTAYALHLAAANIILLVEAHRSNY
jgi:hypothetical protein